MFVEIENIIKEKKYNIELKREVDFKEPENFLEIVNLFANEHDVGYIIFGVDDKNGEIVGIKNVKKSYKEILNKIKLITEPSIKTTIDIINIENKNIILVKVIPKNYSNSEN